MPKKLRVTVIYGGRSGEHEVSLQSAASVIAALDPKKYEIDAVRIGKDGRWNSDRTLLGGQARLLKSPTQAMKTLPEKILNGIISAEYHAYVRSDNDSLPDVVIPIVHGTGGEDGSLQGLLEMTGLPYVGSGVLGSAVGMDKAIQKNILRQAGLPVVESIDFRVAEWKRDHKKILADITRRLHWPMFVKPANLGSSVGISKTRNLAELVRGIRKALCFDVKIIVEQGMENMREIECGVIGETERPRASVPGEIVSERDFYDYSSKYSDGCAQMVIPAKLPADVAEKVRHMAGQVFSALDAYGLARVDFFVTKSARPKIIVNEINTIPGFTRFSMFPKLWEATGLSYSRLLDELIRLAVIRDRRQRKLVRDFAPPSKKSRAANVKKSSV